MAGAARVKCLMSGGASISERVVRSLCPRIVQWTMVNSYDNDGQFVKWCFFSLHDSVCEVGFVQNWDI